MKVNKYGLVAVKILKGIEIYTPGQIAGFVPRIATQMLDKGYAELYKDGLGDEEEAVSSAVVSHSESTSMLASLKAKAAVEQPVTEQPAPVEEQPSPPGGGGSQQQDGPVKVMGIDDEVEIPADWRDLHHTQIKAIARQITGEASDDKDAAVAVITKALEARNAA